MNLARNLIQGAAGGLLGGAVLGLAEASWLLSSQGAPDLLSPFYGTLLYGAVGLPLGLAGGLAWSLVERRKKVGTRADAFAFAFGSIAVVAPVGAFVLNYTLNKVVYAEAGLPLLAKAAVAGAALAYAGLALTLGVRLLLGSLRWMLTGAGALGTFGLLAFVTGVAAVVPWADDPRDHFAHGKPVPPKLHEAPDVIVITVDTLRADHVGAYGMSGATPALDGIAADGVVFEAAFTQASWTRSSFASLWTSRLPSSHNADTKGAMLPEEAELLSEVLQAKGYTTGQLANNVNVTSTFGFDQGYDTFVYESPDYAFGATESVFGLTLYKVVHKLGERYLGGARHVASFYQPADVVLADARAFLEANADGRVFLGVHLMEPHDPYFAHPYLDGSGSEAFNGEAYGRAEHEHPDPADAERLKRLYLDEVRHLDKQLEPFVAWLKATGRYERTLIVVTSDHGEEFGEHGGFWHGTTLYDEQLHVPLIVKLPGNELAGTRVPWQVRALDVAPTITAVVGVEPSAQWAGDDVLTDVRADVAEAAQRAEVLAQKLADAQAVLVELQGDAPEGAATPPAVAGTDADPAVVARRQAQAVVDELTAAPDPCARYRLPRERRVVSEQDFEGNVITAVRAEGFKLIRANAGNPRGLPEAELFDVVDDPGETKDLSGSDDHRCGRSLADVPKQLGEQLGTALQAATSGAVQGGEADVSDAKKRELCALGYLHGPDCE